MTLSIPDSTRIVIEEQAAKNGFRTPQDYLLSLVERDRNRSLREEIENQLTQAAAAPSTPMTAQNWNDIRTTGDRTVRSSRGE